MYIYDIKIQILLQYINTTLVGKSKMHEDSL